MSNVLKLCSSTVKKTFTTVQCFVTIKVLSKINLFFRERFSPGIPKVGQVAPFGGYDRYSGGHEQQRGMMGAMNSKGAKWGPWGHDFNLIPDILQLQMKSKKKGLRCFFW